MLIRIRMSAIMALLIIAALASTAAGGLAQKASKPPPKLAADALIAKLPVGSTFVLHFDLAALRAAPSLSTMASVFAQGFAEGFETSRELSDAFLRSTESMTIGGGADDIAAVLLQGKFQELQGPIFQASLKEAAESTEAYRGLTIFQFDDIALGYHAMIGNTLWAIAKDASGIKKMIDLAFDQAKSTKTGAMNAAGLSAAVKQHGKVGYIFVAAPSDQDSSGGILGAEGSMENLEGTRYFSINMSKKNASTSAVSAYFQFDTAAHAKAAALELQKPESLKEASDFFGDAKVKIKAAKNGVTVDGDVSNTQVAKAFSND